MHQHNESLPGRSNRLFEPNHLFPPPTSETLLVGVNNNETPRFLITNNKVETLPRRDTPETDVLPEPRKYGGQIFTARLFDTVTIANDRNHWDSSECARWRDTSIDDPSELIAKLTPVGLTAAGNHVTKQDNQIQRIDHVLGRNVPDHEVMASATDGAPFVQHRRGCSRVSKKTDGDGLLGEDARIIDGETLGRHRLWCGYSDGQKQQ